MSVKVCSTCLPHVQDCSNLSTSQFEAYVVNLENCSSSKEKKIVKSSDGSIEKQLHWDGVIGKQALADPGFSIEVAGVGASLRAELGTGSWCWGSESASRSTPWNCSVCF
ncbi:hypothetical protein E2C01_050259 [Portunus trituberculatus]|uniref:Uncharacterized protein n=1 Tax=Portunus trituberculatus TaxID=210409 RepID=A0A5B7GFF2_PORTR|nr:hypothetical protein [Portunus trituberculatus]